MGIVTLRTKLPLRVVELINEVIKRFETVIVREEKERSPWSVTTRECGTEPVHSRAVVEGGMPSTTLCYQIEIKDVVSLSFWI